VHVEFLPQIAGWHVHAQSRWSWLEVQNLRTVPQCCGQARRSPMSGMECQGSERAGMVKLEEGRLPNQDKVLHSHIAGPEEKSEARSYTHTHLSSTLTHPRMPCSAKRIIVANVVMLSCSAAAAITFFLAPLWGLAILGVPIMLGVYMCIVRSPSLPFFCQPCYLPPDWLRRHSLATPRCRYRS
jgi:hypothetical protein